VSKKRTTNEYTVDIISVCWFNNYHWCSSNYHINMDEHEMSGVKNTYYLGLIVSKLKSKKCMTVQELSQNTGVGHRMMKDRLSRYTKAGMIFRAARNQYTLDPNYKIEPEPPKVIGTRARRKVQSENAMVMYSCFHKMVSCK
jgi:DNA-binding HxlR family transcriptional regulator